MNNLRYCIINCSDIERIDWSKVKETGPEYLRRSVNGKKTFVKYEGDQPDFLIYLAGDLVGLPEYTNEEIVKVLEGSEWTTQD